VKNRQIISLVVVALVCAGLVLALAAQAAKPSSAEGKFTIVVSDSSVTYSPKGLSGDKDYNIVISNKASAPRGVLISGRDRGGSPFKRFSKMIPKGESETIALYVAKGTLEIRVMWGCSYKDGAVVNPKLGKTKTKIKFK